MKKIIISFIVLLLTFTGCEEYLEQQPVNIITDNIVIEDGASAEAAVLGIYSRLQVAGAYGTRLIALPGVLSDELTHSGSFPSVRDFDNNQLTADNAEIQGAGNLWPTMFTGLYQANIVITALSSDTEYPRLTDANRKLYLAEARGLRALFLFDLVKLFGDVPLAVTTDLDVLGSLSREPATSVYDFVIDEFTDVAAILSASDVAEAAAENSPYRLTQWAVKGLLARALLYTGNVAEAGTIANDIIVNGGFSLEANYVDAFAAGSSESIFSIFYSANDQNGLPFQFLPSGRFEYAVSPQLLAAMNGDTERSLISLNSGDAQQRYAVNKYPDVATGASLVPVVRLAEMYLIRAEASLGTPQALADINIVRARAGLAGLSGNINLDNILNERFVELSFEGHRWNDLIRTGRVDAVMSAINPTTWSPDGFDKLLPIPQRDILQNPNLAPNNPGY